MTVSKSYPHVLYQREETWSDLSVILQTAELDTTGSTWLRNTFPWVCKFPLYRSERIKTDRMSFGINNCVNVGAGSQDGNILSASHTDCARAKSFVLSSDHLWVSGIVETNLSWHVWFKQLLLQLTLQAGEKESKDAGAHLETSPIYMWVHSSGREEELQSSMWRTHFSQADNSGKISRAEVDILIYLSPLKWKSRVRRESKCADSTYVVNRPKVETSIMTR